MRLVYFVGPPGVGKSTLMEALTARCTRQGETKPFAHDYLYRDTTPIAIELGKRREAFSGTDALSMSVQPKAVEWLSSNKKPLVLGEGARLGTYGFLTAAKAAGYDVTLVHLTAPEEALEARRRKRGSNQKATWVKGATSRAKRIFEQMAMDADRVLLAASHPVPTLVHTMITAVPELRTLTDD